MPRLSECWLFGGCRTRNGYGHAWVGGKCVNVHRAAYEALVGPIPAGLVIDHLCRVRHCYNPAHLEPVTPAENTRRGRTGAHWAERTHCPHGHPYSGDNVRYTERGWRVCRACNRDNQQRYSRKRKRAAV